VTWQTISLSSAGVFGVKVFDWPRTSTAEETAMKALNTEYLDTCIMEPCKLFFYTAFV